MMYHPLASFKDQGNLIWLQPVFSPQNIISLCPSVREFMAFTSDVLVERTGVGIRQSVKEQGESAEVHSHDFIVMIV